MYSEIMAGNVMVLPSRDVSHKDGLDSMSERDLEADCSSLSEALARRRTVSLQTCCLSI
jgi:hypothetical protein